MRILDTDVCVEILRGNQKVVARRRGVIDRVATTWITAAELYYGAARSRAPVESGRAVTEFLNTLEIRGLSTQASQCFGIWKARLQSEGQVIADADLLIASVSLAEGAILVTGNLRHYRRIGGLRIEDWIHGALPFEVNEPVTPYG